MLSDILASSEKNQRKSAWSSFSSYLVRLYLGKLYNQGDSGDGRLYESKTHFFLMGLYLW